VAEKVSALRYEGVFPGNFAVPVAQKLCGFSNELAKGNSPMEGDELPTQYERKPGRKAAKFCASD
jgi:hypothetical protein